MLKLHCSELLLVLLLYTKLQCSLWNAISNTWRKLTAGVLYPPSGQTCYHVETKTLEVEQETNSTPVDAFDHVRSDTG